MLCPIPLLVLLKTIWISILVRGGGTAAGLLSPREGLGVQLVQHLLGVHLGVHLPLVPQSSSYPTVPAGKHAPGYGPSDHEHQ